MIIYISIIIFSISILIIYSLCKAAGRADKFEEEIFNKKLNKKRT